MKKINNFSIFLITLGIIILLDTTRIYDAAFYKLWPLLIIQIGIVKIINSFIEKH